MARIRTIKPEFFRHEALSDLEVEYPDLHPMLVFIALWGHCDKQGVFPWRVKQLALDILPFIWEGHIGDTLGRSLMCLRDGGLIQQGESGGKLYGIIPTFLKHQRITGKEGQEVSKYPELKDISIVDTPGTHRGHTGDTLGMTGREGKGREEEGKGKGGVGGEAAASPPAAAAASPRKDKDLATPVEPGSPEHRVAVAWATMVREANPDRAVTAGAVTAGAKQARKLLRRTNEARLKQILRWVTRHRYWAGRADTLGKVERHWTAITGQFNASEGPSKAQERQTHNAAVLNRVIGGGDGGGADAAATRQLGDGAIC